MPALLISSWAQAYGPTCASFHAIGVLLVCLYIGTKFETYVFPIVKVSTSNEISRRQGAGDPILMGKSIQPENGVANQAHHHQSRDSFKWKGVVTASGAVFHGSNVTFNFGDVFILGTH